MMRLAFIIVLSSLLFFSCGKKAKDINGDEPIEASDFIMAFPARSLPIMFNETNLNKKESDSFLIKKNSLVKFIPDSLFKESFGNTDNIKFYRKGAYKADTEETYLFLTAVRKEKKVAYIVCFDKNLAYKAGMQLMDNQLSPGVSTEAGMDKKLTVLKQRNKQSKDGKLIYNKSAYVYNTEGLFTLILTESNEPLEEVSIYNPIDSFPSKGPFSGNYNIDKKNFVSIRDDAKADKLLFFISISKKNGGCEGSLRGDMTKVKTNVFQYNKADDHCIIEFTFTKKNLQVKELEACGNHRGIRCSFDGQFRKGR
jgi:hypothetical protein